LLTEAIWRLVTLQIDPAFDADLMKAGAWLPGSRHSSRPAHLNFHVNVPRSCLSSEMLELCHSASRDMNSGRADLWWGVLDKESPHLLWVTCSRLGALSPRKLLEGSSAVRRWGNEVECKALLSKKFACVKH
jgi:hypothetical protein